MFSCERLKVNFTECSTASRLLFGHMDVERRVELEVSRNLEAFPVRKNSAKCEKVRAKYVTCMHSDISLRV